MSASSGPHGPFVPPFRSITGPNLPLGWGDMKVVPEQAALWGALLPGPYVSIVGTRRPSSHGWQAAHRLAAQLARAGVTIVSGGALGIDSAAHQGALSVQGQTMVVGPTRFPEAYPQENLALFETILRHGGGYLSLAEAGQIPFNPAFFLRNEAMMAMSHAVVLGECPFKSGAKNAMLHARRMERVRFVLPFPYDEPRAAGSWDEIVHRGGRLLFDVREIFDVLSQRGSFDNPRWWSYLLRRRERCLRKDEDSRAGSSGARRKATSPVAPQKRAGFGLPVPASGAPRSRVSDQVTVSVQNALRKGAVTIDQICESTQLSVPVIQHQLSLLTLQGLVYEDARGLLRYHPDSS